MTFEQFIIECDLPSEVMFEYGASLYNVYMRLKQVIIAERIVEWFKKDNLAFDNRSPLDLTNSGELNRIVKMLDEIDHSVF